MPVLTSNAGTPVAGQPISEDDPTGPKWPETITTPGLGSNEDGNGPVTAVGSSGLVRTVEEKVNQFTSPTASTPTTSNHYVFFRRNATIDFSNPDKPTVTPGGWEVFSAPHNTLDKALKTEYYPGFQYESATELLKTFDAKTQIAKAFDAQGNPVELKDIDVGGFTVYGLPAFKVDADSANSVFNIIYYTLNDLQRTSRGRLILLTKTGQSPM